MRGVALLRRIQMFTNQRINCMKQTIRLWLSLAMLLALFSACSKDSKSEPTPGSSLTGEPTNVSLSAEASLDEDDALKALTYELGTNSAGQTVPMPRLEDGQRVLVHTALKSSDGTFAVKSLYWTYSATTKRLRLKQTEANNSFTVSNFNNEGGRTWYISAIIGGTLEGTTVKFAGRRNLKGVSAIGELTSELDVPYVLGWQELKMDKSQAPVGGSYLGAILEDKVTFVPRGALVGYILGNKIPNSSPLNPTSFSISTNAFTDQGAFELNTNATPGALPTWSATASGTTSMVYTLAETAQPIAENQTSTKTYYAWVMPTATALAAITTNTRIKSSTPVSSLDVARSYRTDYTPNATTGGKPQHGKVHRLRINANEFITIPIQYMTEYNIAGGEGITSTLGLAEADQFDGMKGGLRFANYNSSGINIGENGHLNNQSGFYSRSLAEGLGSINMMELPAKDINGNQIARLGEKYRVPTHSDWQGIVMLQRLAWGGLDRSSNDFFTMGDGANRQALASSSESISTDQRDVIYAIRFRKLDTSESILMSNQYQPHTPLKSDELKCAYRYRYVDKGTIRGRVVIDVVYLGEEPADTETTTTTISENNGQWWVDRASEGKVITRILPALGEGLWNINTDGRYIAAGGDYSVFWIDSELRFYTHYGPSLRLFYRSL